MLTGLFAVAIPLKLVAPMQKPRGKVVSKILRQQRDLATYIFFILSELSHKMHFKDYFAPVA